MDDIGAMIESSICAILRGEGGTWPDWRSSEYVSRLRDCVAYHGVGPLLSRRLRDAWPPGLPAPRELKYEAAIELVRKDALIGLLEALDGSDVVPLLLKGTALAHSLYPSPVMRPRADTDILIDIRDREITDRALSQLGYEKPNAVSGELLTYQCGYVKQDRFGIEHVLDVHWRISNTQLFSCSVDYAELMSRSTPLPELGLHARAPGRADSLLLACLHRVHHFHSAYRVEGVPSLGPDRLIWLYDIHLLIEAMTSQELEGFARLAEEKRMQAVCIDGVLQARRCFHTRLPAKMLRWLESAEQRESSAAHLRAGGARHLLTELRSLPSWRDRFVLLREHLFPPSDYMLEKYAVANRAWLPMLYVQRGIHGAWRRILSS